MDHDRILKYSVLESRYDVLKRLYANKDLSGLTAREDVTSYASHSSYTRRAHDLPTSDDKGYMVYFDELRQRNIYVSSKEVGLSNAFHTEKDIQYLFHMICKSNNHQHSTDMTPSRRQWWTDNMQYIALQLFETEGNVVLFCNNGRTRSPMYIVAYLIIIYGMNVNDAMHVIEKLLMEQRHLELDRYDSLLAIVVDIHAVDYDE